MSHGTGPSHPERDDRLDPGGRAGAPQGQSEPRERFVPDPVEHDAAGRSAAAAADDPRARQSAANQAAQGEVVVGIDGSDAAQAALGWALRYGRLTGGPLHAVAVWQQPPPVGGAPTMISDEELEQEADRLLRRAIADLPAAPARTTVTQGEPSQQLVENSSDADVLVLGNHGHGAVAGALLGSVAQRCAHHARCPVVLVPADGQPM